MESVLPQIEVEIRPNYDTCGITVKLKRMISGAQIRAARALLRWSGEETSRRSGISLPTIKRLEQSDGVPPSRSQTLETIRKVFEAAGIEFVGDPDLRPGVRLNRR